MSGTTAKGYPYPTGTDGPDGADVVYWIQALANFLQANGAMYDAGTIEARPAATKAGRLYRSTNESPNAVYLDTGAGSGTGPTGTGWLNVSSIGDGSVLTAMLADNAVTAAKLADDSVDTAALQALAVTAAKLAAGAVTSAKLADAIKPSAGASDATEAVRALGIGAGKALGILQIASLVIPGALNTRPLATDVPAGTEFVATDTLGTWRSDGATWTLIQQGRPRISTATFLSGTGIMGAPYDGQELAVIANPGATTQVLWELTWNAGTSHWETTGGGDWLEVLSTGRNVSASVGVWGAFSTEPGPSITPPITGTYLLRWGGQPGTASGGTTSKLGLGINGADPAAGDQVTVNESSRGALLIDDVRALTAGQALTLKGLDNDTTRRLSWAHRTLAIRLLRV